MAYRLTLPLLQRYYAYFTSLAKAGVDFEIEVAQQYDSTIGGYAASLVPKIKDLRGFPMLAKVWEAGSSAIKVSHVSDFPGFKEIYGKPNAVKVTAKLYKEQNASIKYFAEEVLEAHAQGTLGVFLLHGAPVEKQEGDRTYRICCTTGDFYHGEIIYCASELDKYYNYIDQGHILVTHGGAGCLESSMFITDVLTLDMNYILAAFSLHPDCVTAFLRDKAFLPSKDARMTLIRVEKSLPAKLQPEYQKRKAEILADFEKNAQNVMIGRLTRGETPHVDLNAIRISRTRAVYAAGNVSIEADNLAEVIFKSLNPDEEWDIFSLINIYTDWVEQQFMSLDMSEGAGFKEKKTFRFRINDIPMKVECFKEHTRRAVNGYLINLHELSKVMRRAACYLPEPANPKYDNAKEYNAFLKEVARVSLRVRDILSNGLPVKTMFLAGDAGVYNKDASVKHPKLRFTRDAKTGFHLVIKTLDKKGEVTQTVERRIGKFVEFVNKVENLNRKVQAPRDHYNNEWEQTHEGGWVRKDGAPNACAVGLVELLKVYAEKLTEEDTKTLVGTVNREMTEAEKRSEELLQEAAKMVGAKKEIRDGKPGWRVPGTIRNYFVEEDSLRVYNADTKEYLCVVNGNGDQGIGKDALVARLYALHNDSMITEKVGTIRAK